MKKWHLGENLPGLRGKILEVGHRVWTLTRHLLITFLLGNLLSRGRTAKSSTLPSFRVQPLPSLTPAFL